MLPKGQSRPGSFTSLFDIAADAMTETHLFIQVLLLSATTPPKLAVHYLTEARGPRHLETILATLQRIEASQTESLAKVVPSESGLKATDATVQPLSTRLSAVATRLDATSTISGNPPILNMSVELANIPKQCEDNENWLRRLNLLFLGSLDD